MVEKLLRIIFERARSINESELIQQRVQDFAVQCRQKLQKVQTEHTKAVRELAKWEGLMLDSIEGTCVFTPEQIKRWIDTVQETVARLAEQIDALQEQAAETEIMAKEIRESHQRLLSWADMFDTVSIEEKKMLASYLIKAVTLTRDYGIQIEVQCVRSAVSGRDGDGIVAFGRDIGYNGLEPVFTAENAGWTRDFFARQGKFSREYLVYFKKI